jgi:integrase
VARSTLSDALSVLRLAIRRAQKRDLVGRNVAELADLPAGLATRKSRSMTEVQADQLLASDLSPWWRAWLTIALRLGLRPGELGALRWEDIAGGVLRVRHSLQDTEDGLVIGGLKTESSRRAMEMPAEVAAALAAWKREQSEQRLQLGPHWHDLGLVFTTDDGHPVNRQAVHRGFRAATKAAGIGVWQPRECRHTFVSTMSEEGADIEEISDAVGHVNSHITKVVYRHQIAEVVSGVARRMDARKQATS